MNKLVTAQSDTDISRLDKHSVMQKRIMTPKMARMVKH